MRRALVVTGTDTGIGKTVASAALMLALDADYWKPIQAGLGGETDTEAVQRLTALPAARFHREAYRLTTPASPHHAAEIDGVTIDERRLVPPASTRLLVIEGVGGLMVPLRRDLLQIDVFASWHLPVVVCASTRLGTINHTLLSIEALRRRAVVIAGVVFVGPEVADTIRTIADLSEATVLGRLPLLSPLDTGSLSDAAACLGLSPLASLRERVS